MNIKGSVTNFSLTLALIGMSFDSSVKAILCSLALILAVYGIIILFENISPQPKWKTIVSYAKELDLTHFAFGLGMISLSSTMFEKSLIWPGILLLLSGGLLGALNSANLIGSGGAKIIKQKFIVGILIGLALLILGVIRIYLDWNSSADANTLEKMRDVSTPIMLASLGIIFIWHGCRRWRNLRRSKL